MGWCFWCDNRTNKYIYSINQILQKPCELRIFRMKFLLIFLFSISLFAADKITFDNRVEKYKSNLAQGKYLHDDYKELNVYWRELVDLTPQQISKVEVFGALRSRSVIINDQINNHFEKLLVVGNLRRKYLKNEYIRAAIFDVDQLSIDFFWDLKREFQLVPMRLFAELLLKIKYVKENLGNGFVGIKILIFDLSSIFLLLLIPVLAFFVLKRFKEKFKVKLVDLRMKRFKSSKDYKIYSLSKVTVAYAPDILMYFLLRLLRGEQSSFSFFLALAEIYFLYKITITLCYYLLSFVFDKSIARENQSVFEKKKKRNSKRVGYFFFFYSVFFHLIEYIVGGGIISELLILIIKLNLAFIIFVTSGIWASEMSQVFKPRTNDKIAQNLLRGLSGKRKWIFSFFAFLYVVYLRVSNLLIKSLERFDFFKQVSAKFFKRKLISTESFVESDIIKIPDDYKCLFERETSDDNFISVQSSLIENIGLNINAWMLNSNEENSIAICGHKGSGKTTLFNEIKSSYKEKLNFVDITFESRITNEVDFISKIYKSLGKDESESLMGLIKIDKELPKTIIFLEKSHNLFLSCLNGFSSYKKLIEVLNTRFENIFWIASFNENSWNFLSAVYSKNESFRFIYKLKGWSDSDIQKMILKRHNLSDYKISFNKILKAIGNFDSESLEEAQEQFFRVLWEQSQGNPQIAMYLWLSSLTFVSRKKIYVGLPQDDGLKELSRFSDNTLFVFAAIVKHENLSVSQAMVVTNLDEGVVRYAMKLGLENDILIRNNTGQYSFFVRFNFRVINYLKKKNLIIGN